MYLTAGHNYVDLATGAFLSSTFICCCPLALRFFFFFLRIFSTLKQLRSKIWAVDFVARVMTFESDLTTVKYSGSTHHYHFPNLGILQTIH